MALLSDDQNRWVSCEGLGNAVSDSPEDYLLLDDDVLVGQCDVDLYRASGPGGQKRNKTSSAVRLRHRPTGLVANASDDRSQHVNRRRATRRLRETIALHLRRSVDISAYEPSELLSDCITRDGRLVVGLRDRRYSPVVQEVLDVMTACNLRVSEAASCLGVSTANMIKLIRKDPKLWGRVNQMRTAAGLKALR